jgi:hypothetical protein
MPVIIAADPTIGSHAGNIVTRRMGDYLSFDGVKLVARVMY